jgi:hypothetical protein
MSNDRKPERSEEIRSLAKGFAVIKALGPSILG